MLGQAKMLATRVAPFRHIHAPSSVEFNAFDSNPAQNRVILVPPDRIVQQLPTAAEALPHPLEALMRICEVQ